MAREKTVVKSVRLSPAEWERIQELAQTADMSVSEYFRRCALGQKLLHSVDQRMIRELCRLGGLQKHLFLETQGYCEAQTLDILKEVKAALERVGKGGLPDDN